MKCIVFITNMSSKKQQIWLNAFSQLLPNEQFVLPEELTDEDALAVDIAIVANPDVNELKRFPHLQWVQSLWAGVESLIPYFQKRNDKKETSIPLVRLIDPQLADTMAEAVLAWTLYLHRTMPEYAAQQRNKIWQPIDCPVAKQIRVSILGAGELGRASMQRLLQNHYQVNAWSRQAKELAGVTHYSGEEGLVPLLQNTDILICLLPLTAQTHHLLNQQTLMHLPKGSKLINFARGGIINHEDLYALLAQRHLQHAVLDVFEQEPLDINSPLWTHPNITILPHISATTNLASASQVVANNISLFREKGVIPKSVDLIQAY